MMRMMHKYKIMYLLDALSRHHMTVVTYGRVDKEIHNDCTCYAGYDLCASVGAERNSVIGPLST